MTGIRSLLSSAANRVADAASSLAETAQNVSDTAKSVANKASSVADDLKPETNPQDLDQDSWERADAQEGLLPKALNTGLVGPITVHTETIKEVARGARQGLEKVQQGVEKTVDLAKTTRAKAEDIRDAFVEDAKLKVSHDLARAAEWIGPSVQTVKEIKEIRQDIQKRVEEGLQQFDPEEIKEGLKTGTTGLLEIVQNAATTRQEADLQRRAEMGNIQNRALNFVDDITADFILERRESITAVGGGIRAMGDLLASMPFIGTDPDAFGKSIIETTFPSLHMGMSVGVWALESMGRAVEGTVEVAEHIKAGPGLPTKDDFDLWIDAIKPGETRSMGGSLGLSIAFGPKLAVSMGKGYSLHRSEENPNQITFQLSNEARLGVGAGEELQGRGISLSGNLNGATGVEFTFDISDPAEFQRLEDLVLGHHTGFSTKNTVQIAGDHLTRFSLEGGLSSQGSMGFVSNLQLETGTNAFLDTKVGGDGEFITQVGLRRHGELSARLSPITGQIPERLINELISSIPNEGSELAGQILGAVFGGSLGGKHAFSGELSVGMELHGLSPDNLYVEAKVAAERFDLQGELHLKLSVHQLDELSDLMGTSTSALQEQLIAGTLDMGFIFDTIVSSGLDPTDVLGLELKLVTTEQTGLDMDFFGLVGLHDTTSSTTTRDLVPALFPEGAKGRNLLRNFRQEAELRQLDRIINC